MIAVQEGSYKNLPTIAAMTSVDEQSMNALSEILHGILQNAARNENFRGYFLPLDSFDDNLAHAPWDNLLNLLIYSLFTRLATY